MLNRGMACQGDQYTYILPIADSHLPIDRACGHTSAGTSIQQLLIGRERDGLARDT